jgi:hypothetical protein
VCFAWTQSLTYRMVTQNSMRFAKDSPRSILLVFSQFYIKYDFKKNKIVVPFFCQLINFYELIVRF